MPNYTQREIMTVVIFDMDGTLINSKDDITTSINYVRKNFYALAPLSENSVVDAINSDHQNLALEFYERTEYEDGAREMFETHYHKQCTESAEMYEGIKELIETLHARGIKMGVATNAPTPLL